jgi:flagellar export protein FliJ
MKRFKFTLEAVQTVRERAAREALEVYARAVRARTAAEAALAAVEEAKVAQMAEWRAAMKKGFSASDMVQNAHAQTLLEASRVERAEELRKASEAMAKALAALRLARQKSEVVEKFHTRQRNEFNLNELKEEQKAMDEMALSRRDSGPQMKEAAHA